MNSITFFMKAFWLCVLLSISFFSFGQKHTSSIGFIENKGQIVDQKGKENKGVKYLLNANGLNVQLRQNGFSYDVYEVEKIPLTKTDKEFYSLDSKEKDNKPDFSTKINFHRIDIDFLNSNKNIQLLAEEKSADYDNYYNVLHAPDGITNVHKYQKVTYKNIYNNIDVVFFIPKDSTKVVEYNFIIKPGGKVSDIQLKFNGAKTDLIDNKIQMNLRFGKMEETLPLSWIENDPSKEEISINYKKNKKNVYGFESELNNSNKTIVIDPVPVRLWGTYYGGGHQAFKTNTTKVDNNDNIIFSGLTYSSNNVGTAGSFQSTGIPLWETAFLAKMNPSGNRIWGTYVKNNIYEARIYDLITNSTNDIYVGGYTWDQDGLANTITTPGAFREFGGAFSREGILMKFDENGQRIWGTFYGGLGFDEIRTIDLDSNENLIIAGQTNSSSGISTNNSYLTSNPNSNFYSLGFFAKFDSNGNRIYGSYYQGMITFCKIDSNDNIYFTGQYSESNEYTNITTLNAHQTVNFYTDIFLVKFNSNFNREWCTYYGGTEYTSSFGNSDKVTGLGSDILNNVYLVGTTSSSNNIATLGSFKESQTFGSVDAFIVKFDSTGIRQWGTYFGGNSTIFDETGESGFVSPEGNIYIAGNTRNSLELISTPNSFQPLIDGSDECFFSKFDTNGNLIWCSYYGTPSQDYSSNIFYKNNIVYLFGYSTAIATNGNDLGTPGTHMPNGGGFFLGKFQDCISSPQAFALNPCIGSNLELTASGGTNYLWTGPNGFTSTDQNPIIPNITTSESGQYLCEITGTGGCDDTITLNIVIGDTIAPVPNITSLPQINGDCNTVISTIPTALDNCAGTINATTTDPLTYSVPGNYTITWNFNDGNGNSSSQTQNVTITSVNPPTLTSPQTFCFQDNATISNIAITGQNITWYDAQTSGNILTSTTALQNDITYYATQTINNCESDRTPILVTIQNTPVPTGSATQTFCSTQNASLNDISINGTNIIWYADNTSTTALSNSTVLLDNTSYFATQIVNGCESPTRFEVLIDLINTLNALDYQETICDDLDDGFEIINLTSFNSNLITTTGNTFSYYTSLNGAENQISSAQINNVSNYNLNIGTTTIFVRIDSQNGCHQVVELKLTLVSKPRIAISDIMPICEGTSITINAGNGFDSYNWSTGATTQSTLVSQAGNYSVTVTENHNGISCSSTKSFTVVNSNAATVSEIITSDWTDNNNTITVLISNSSVGNYVYSLDGINYQNSNVFYELESGEHTVFVKDTNGCGISSEEIYLLMYPKYFTPNGDSYNDTWKIKFSQKEPNLKVTIFDRYGKLLKIMNSYDAWDGKLNGKDLPSDDYWFVVTRQNGKEFRGHFAMKR